MNNIFIATLNKANCHAIIAAEQVLPSKVGAEAGEGVFARRALAKATTVCLYSGLTMTRVSLAPAHWGSAVPKDKQAAKSHSCKKCFCLREPAF